MCLNPTLVLACAPLSRKHHYPSVWSLSWLVRRLPWTGCAKEARETSHLFLSHLQALYFLTLCSPTVFLASRHFYINLFTGPPSSFAPSLQSQLSSFLSSPTAPLGVLSHHYCLCLPSLSLLGISVFAQFSYPTHFMNLIPFLTVCFQVWGQILICLLPLPHHLLSRSQLCSLIITTVMHLPEYQGYQSYPGWDRI